MTHGVDCSMAVADARYCWCGEICWCKQDGGPFRNSELLMSKLRTRSPIHLPRCEMYEQNEPCPTHAEYDMGCSMCRGNGPPAGWTPRGFPDMRLSPPPAEGPVDP